MKLNDFPKVTPLVSARARKRTQVFCLAHPSTILQWAFHNGQVIPVGVSEKQKRKCSPDRSTDAVEVNCRNVTDLDKPLALRPLALSVSLSRRWRGLLCTEPARPQTDDSGGGTHFVIKLCVRTRRLSREVSKLWGESHSGYLPWSELCLHNTRMLKFWPSKWLHLKVELLRHN